MIDQAQIDVFIDALSRYFNHLDTSIEEGACALSCRTGYGLEVGAPYLLKSTQPMGLDFTGMISVSGNSTGTIFVSARSALLQLVLLSHGEKELSIKHKRDLIGEIANTLAGNARRHLGAEFHISTPRVLEGALEPVNYKLSSRCFILPFRWRSNKAELIISVQPKTP